MLLTKNKMNWGHFASRTRKGAYDRLLIGLRVESRPWLSSIFKDVPGDAVAQVFILGVGNVAFAHEQGATKLYANIHAGAQAREYIEWYAEQGNMTIEYIDGLPTATHARASSGRKVDSFMSACVAALEFQPTKDLGI